MLALKIILIVLGSIGIIAGIILKFAGKAALADDQAFKEAYDSFCEEKGSMLSEDMYFSVATAALNILVAILAIIGAVLIIIGISI